MKLGFPQPLNREQFGTWDAFTAKVEGKSLTIAKLHGGIWSANFIARLVLVADSSVWKQFPVGKSDSNPYYVDLPEENMRIIPYPCNTMEAGFSDTFDVEITGKRLKVTRTDRNSTWGMHLKFYIAPGTGTPPSAPSTAAPSSSPTASTSSSPTAAPSSSPTSSPTAPPTASASSSPTASPSSSPVEDCSEQPESKFFFRWNGQKSVKKCSWLSITNKQKKEAACAMQDNSVDGMPPASVMCRESCELCPKGPSSQPSPSPSTSMAPSFQGDCSQNGSSRFLFSINQTTGKESWKTCNDLAGWNATKRRNACGRDYDNGREAKFMCRTTCGTCPSECELHVEELEERNAALQRRLDDLEAKKKKRV